MSGENIATYVQVKHIDLHLRTTIEDVTLDDFTALISGFTFAFGLTNLAGIVTNDLTTGVSGGQAITGGTGSTDALTLKSTSDVNRGGIRIDEDFVRLKNRTATTTPPSGFIHFYAKSDNFYFKDSAGAEHTLGGVASLNTLTAATQSLAKVNDTNVTLTIASLTDTHTFTIGWSGTLSVARGGTGTSTAPTNGQLLIGNAGGYSVASLTPGSQMSVTPGAGTLTIACTVNSVVEVASAVGNSSTISWSGLTPSVVDSSITLAKMADLSASTLIGRRSGSTGSPQAITLGSNLSMSSGGVLSAASSGITTLNTLTGTTQTFANSNDTNITLTISSISTTHTFAAGWSGTLSLARGGTAAALSAPGANTLLGWDNTDTSVCFITLGSGLSYNHSTHTLSASGGGYTPSTPSDWAGSPPTTVADALDRLAAVPRC